MGIKTVSEIAAENGLHANMISALAKSHCQMVFLAECNTSAT